MAGNREYKSDVFGMLMEEPGYALEVYNALNHSDYRDSGLVEICKLERGISLSVRNDAAFILDMDLSVYEHESTVCTNMPLREEAGEDPDAPVRGVLQWGGGAARAVSAEAVGRIRKPHGGAGA